MAPLDVAVVVPVYGNEATLPELTLRLATALDGRRWRLRLVIDASPDDSLVVARTLAEHDDRIAVTPLVVNQGQHRALTRGLVAEESAGAWVCLDADLQDPPEAVPGLLDRLAVGDVETVFAGRRGRYEPRGRLLTGRLHRAALSRITGLPPDAGAFVAMGAAARDAVVAFDGPSVVAAIGAARVPTTSIPVERARRIEGTTAWTPAARLRQSARTLAWTFRSKVRRAAASPTGSPRRAV